MGIFEFTFFLIIYFMSTFSFVLYIIYVDLKVSALVLNGLSQIFYRYQQALFQSNGFWCVVLEKACFLSIEVLYDFFFGLY